MFHNMPEIAESAGHSMFVSEAPRFASVTEAGPTQRAPHIVIGITSSQTCLTLTGRLRALREAGFRVTLVSSPGELLTRTAEREGVEPAAIPMRREIAPWADFVSLFRLVWLLFRLNPDMTEFSTPKAGLLGGVAATLLGVPTRIYMLRGLKVEGTSGLKRRILIGAERIASACAHVVLCNSESLRQEALALGMAPTKKLNMLGDGSSNGVNIERFSPGPSNIRERLELPQEAVVVGFVGRLTRDKGVPELIEAFDTILRTERHAHLLLMGWFDAAEDALDSEMRRRIEKHPRIHCTGYMADTAPYYRAMDVMVLPTWREGFPNVVLEAAASGIPVVTTIATGSRDSVVPEVTGLLIPPGYPAAISEAVLKLLGDPARRRRMGVAARAWVVEHYASDHVLGLITDYYKGLLSRPFGETAAEPAKALVPAQR
jgi:glycosyltransferase involved in cell wall biosynthesis